MEAGQKCCWGIFRQGKVMVLSPEMLVQIRASSTMIWGWYDKDEVEAWKLIFPLTTVNLREGSLPLTDAVWMEWDHPWWIFPSDKPTKEEARIFNWRALSLLSLEQSLGESS